MVAAVLALGDVDFAERPEAGDGESLTALSEPSRPRLEAAARLLDVSADRILNALTSRKINAGISNQVCVRVRVRVRCNGGGGPAARGVDVLWGVGGAVGGWVVTDFFFVLVVVPARSVVMTKAGGVGKRRAGSESGVVWMCALFR